MVNAWKRKFNSTNKVTYTFKGPSQPLQNNYIKLPREKNCLEFLCVGRDKSSKNIVFLLQNNTHEGEEFSTVRICFLFDKIILF